MFWGILGAVAQELRLGRGLGRGPKPGGAVEGCLGQSRGVTGLTGVYRAL